MGRRIAVAAKAAEVGPEFTQTPEQGSQPIRAANGVLVTPFEAFLLPWEERDAFRALHADFYAEYQPESATERSLVDQLVWIEWRRRRLMLGERSAHLASLNERLDGDYKAQGRRSSC